MAFQLDARQKNILEAIIKEYQKTDLPVASQVLVEKYKFDLSPATIRAEMKELDEKDLLAQPHHSAGRVPTTKAYRLYVDDLIKRGEIKPRDGARIKRKLKSFDFSQMVSYQLAQVLADFSHNLGFSGLAGEEVGFQEVGWPWLLADEELRDPDIMVSVLQGFEALERDFNNFLESVSAEIGIFIGEENPFKGLNKCSLVVSACELNDKKVLIGILGPKRMDYARNIFLVQEIKNTLEKARS